MSQLIICSTDLIKILIQSAMPLKCVAWKCLSAVDLFGIIFIDNAKTMGENQTFVKFVTFFGEMEIFVSNESS